MVMMAGFLTRENFRENLCVQILFSFKCFENLSAVQLGERRSDNCRLAVVLTDQINRCVNLLLRSDIRACQDNCAGILDLVEKELAEVLDVHYGFLGVNNCYGAVQLHIRDMFCRVVNRAHDIIEFAYAGGLNQDSLGRVLLHYLRERCLEIADQRAADAAAVHLADLNAGFL